MRQSLAGPKAAKILLSSASTSRDHEDNFINIDSKKTPEEPIKRKLSNNSEYEDEKDNLKNYNISRRDSRNLLSNYPVVLPACSFCLEILYDPIIVFNCFHSFLERCIDH